MILVKNTEPLLDKIPLYAFLDLWKSFMGKMVVVFNAAFV